MNRLILFSLAVPLAMLAAGGCPAEPPGDSSEPLELSPQAEAPALAAKGETVSLTARLADDIEPGSVTYRWFQTYGRVVEIINGYSPEASFVAPSLPTEQTLRFRVDVQGADGTIDSAEVEVAVAADPNFGLDESVEEEDTGDEDPHPQVRLRTSMGSIVLELDRVKAPLTVSNFLRYVDDSFYNGTIFHRVIPDFVVQGGGFEPGLVQKDARPPIRNESDNGLKNERGTVAMARLKIPDSATSQFYINLADNESLDATSGANGYAVFGRVIQGMDVVDRIAEVETESRERFDDVPVQDVLLMNALRITSGGDGSVRG
ncbi:MAG: peptidylprolyl isomerase [Phycisphaerae bacterium]